MGVPTHLIRFTLEQVSFTRDLPLRKRSGNIKCFAKQRLLLDKMHLNEYLFYIRHCWTVLCDNRQNQIILLASLFKGKLSVFNFDL